MVEEQVKKLPCLLLQPQSNLILIGSLCILFNPLHLKKSSYILRHLVLFAACKYSSVIYHASTESKEKISNLIIDNIINTASESIGIRYKAAGTTKSGYDCSGLVYSTFRSHNMKLSRSSYEQSKKGIDLGQNLKYAKKGDLIFFKTNKRSQINHIGNITEVEDNDIKFIHATKSKGGIISSMSQNYYQKTFIQLDRVLK